MNKELDELKTRIDDIEFENEQLKERILHLEEQVRNLENECQSWHDPLD